jgi:curli biogenesis system outer membrane secretion channel CsgG
MGTCRDLDLPPYDGPPAHIAVGPCENRTRGAGTFTVGDTRISLDNEIGRGMGDMLVSALVNTARAHYEKGAMQCRPTDSIRPHARS